MKGLIKRFWRDSSAATMVEYALLLALIAFAVVVTVVLLGNEMDAAFQRVLTCVQNLPECATG